MNQYSMGPWRLSRSDAGLRIETAGRRPIAAMIKWADPLAQEANATLMACAPEMAMMLLSMFSHVSHGGPTRAEAEALLKKAGVL